MAVRPENRQVLRGSDELAASNHPGDLLAVIVGLDVRPVGEQARTLQRGHVERGGVMLRRRRPEGARVGARHLRLVLARRRGIAHGDLRPARVRVRRRLGMVGQGDAPEAGEVASSRGRSTPRWPAGCAG